MSIPKSDLISVLQEFNPWWSNQPISDLPEWERFALREILVWAGRTNSSRALLLSGARQVGKTTLFRQTIRRLLNEGFPPGNIFYATFDHPILKLSGLGRALQSWEELFPVATSHPRLLFLDEIQYVSDWQTWLKHRVDFRREYRIAVTGSASPLQEAAVESGVGRWETIPLPTLSFGEYLKLRGIASPKLPNVKSLRDLFDWKKLDFLGVGATAKPLAPHFHEYLLRGGFPEPAMADDIVRCQRLLREDVEKVLKRDMTAIYGVRRVIELEKIFVYLCYHNGGILDLATLARELQGVTKQSVAHYLSLFESTHLIYRLKPHGYGKEVLRGRDKVYLADAALPGAMMLLGRRLLEQPERLGAAVETAFFKHVYTRYYAETPVFSYWRDRKHKDQEVDLIAQTGDRLVPFEVKYQDSPITLQRLVGMSRFLEQHDVEQGYVITRNSSNFSVLRPTAEKKGVRPGNADFQILLIPAHLACFWLSQNR